MEKTLIWELIVPMIWDIMNLMSVWGEWEKLQLSSYIFVYLYTFLYPKIWACDL